VEPDELLDAGDGLVLRHERLVLRDEVRDLRLGVVREERAHPPAAERLHLGAGAAAAPGLVRGEPLAERAPLALGERVAGPEPRRDGVVREREQAVGRCRSGR
jgi:hypothetical protein